ncbi:glycerophosphodiester phosphodiesterase family protein [uncultured Pseudoteredinibacter sp.]|uniref:glycerophosphodiester phosphodiesterase n=1 Tax=uncultured Pseudoteredinibacter sp. TaxID=1641701 RepID=UPI002605B44A|nr:glycerophosphodiester phosphodiesterase family protein [uncultured Pseudoteredinibacter sp.]
MRMLKFVSLLLVSSVGFALILLCYLLDVGVTREAAADTADSHLLAKWSREPVVVGHRGAGKHCPENTAICYQQALDQGALAFEADLQVLGDGSLVMFHDDNIKRQSGVDRDLSALNLAGFKQYNMAWYFNPGGQGVYPYRNRPVYGMSFKEFLSRFPDIPILLDVKPETVEMAQALLAFIPKEFTSADYQRVYIKSNSLWLPRKLRQLSPQPRVAFSRYERALLLLFPSLLNELPASWIDLETQYQSAEIKSWASSNHHILSASTLDTVGELEELRKKLNGQLPDAVVTNHPAILHDYLSKLAAKE